MYPEDAETQERIRTQDRIDSMRRTALNEACKAAEIDSPAASIVASADVFANFLLKA